MPNQRWACTPQQMSHSVKSAPAIKSCRFNSVSISRQAPAVSPIDASMADRSRCSTGVRTRPQNTALIGRLSTDCCASIQ